MASATTPPPSKTSSHSDLQIVPISNPDAAPASSGCWEAFKRALCCCFPAAQQHHHVDPHPAPISSKHLIENYGELISRTAQLLAHINLDREAPLSDVETETLARTTGFIQNHLDVLKKMIQHVKYYNDALKPQSLPQEPDALVASPPIHIDGAESEFKAEQVDVSKRNGQIEKFAERKIVIGLQEAPFQNPLSEEQIDQIITRVKQEIALLQTGGVNTAFIRSIVSQEASRLGAQIAPPPFLAHISSADITEHVQQVKGIEELTPEDCAALVQQIPGYSDINEETVLAHSDNSSAD